MDSVALVPATIAWSDQMWAWMQEAPDLNLDDSGPQTAEAFADELTRRLHTEWVWGVTWQDQPVGAIGVALPTARVAWFHGIVFTQAVHGLGVSQTAVLDVLGGLWDLGVAKVSASYFADNVRVGRFLSRLGAQPEGLLKQQTTRHGQPVDLQLVAFFRES